MTYEYVCEACGHEWEADHPISQPALKDCPSCGKAAAKRQISGGAGFILKGGGWYADGYGSAQTGASSSKGKSSSSTESKASDSSSGGGKSAASSSDSGSSTQAAPAKPASA